MLILPCQPRPVPAFQSGVPYVRLRPVPDVGQIPKAMGWTPPHLNGIKVPDWKFAQPVNREKGSTMKLIRVGVDLAKSVFQVHGVDRSEKAVWRRKLSREEWLKVLLAERPPRLRDRHGSLRWCAPLGARACRRTDTP